MARYIKTYKTRSNEARIPIQLGDITVDAHFLNGNIRDNQWAMLTTKDSLVQFVIENSPLFGNKILLEESVPIDEEVDEVDMKPEDVTTLAEAREYMEKVYGINQRSISSPNALKSSIAKHQVVFPNLNL